MKRNIAVGIIGLFVVAVIAALSFIASPASVSRAAYSGPQLNIAAPDRQTYVLRQVDATVATTTTSLSPAYVGNWANRIDVQYRIAAASANTNSVTVTMQLMFSNDTSSGFAPTDLKNWVAGPVFLAATGYAAAADSTDMTQTLNLGYYTAISYTVTSFGNSAKIIVMPMYK